ncbi:MAG: WD40 repeat domain-containing protein [Treponema sp.]|nr:WD40 repeat domain-containing protein [Treponema sp.]
MKRSKLLRAKSILAAGFIAGLLLVIGADVPAQSGDAQPTRLAGKHNGQINAVVYDQEDRVLSAGADGFLGIWNIRNGGAEERFQVSSYSLVSMALRPGETQVAFIESDGLGLYRISAWDYREKQNLFILRFRDPISYITYSAGGNFIILSRSARTGVVFLHPETGELLQSPESFSESVSFAATGRSERTMISYSPIGVLSYWELESGREIRHFTAPPNIRTPILFGNNRFFGGFDNRGLVILDAVSGNEILRNSQVPRGILYPAGQEQAEFICLPVEENPRIIRYGLSSTGRLEIRSRGNLPSGGNSAASLAVTSVAAAGAVSFLGTSDGRIWSLAENGTARAFASMEQIAVREAGASGRNLGLITANNFLGFLPLNFEEFIDQEPIVLENAGQYTHIAAEIAPHVPYGAFLFWQSEGGRQVPLVREYPGGGRLTLDQVPLQFPLRSAAVLGNLALFLDAVGNITVVSLDTGDLRFSFFAAGALDAAFMDARNIVIGRSAVLGNTPFLKVDITTGETVPLAYPAAIGARIYRSENGALYGAAVTSGTDGIRTSILRLDTANPSRSARLVEYQGEDTGFGIAESGGVLASTIGGDGVTLYGALGLIAFERSPGLPLRLINGGNRFITLDAEGSVVWYDNQTGELLALLRFYPGEWVLEQRDGPEKGGRLLYN